MSKIELKPCPVCGRMPKIKRDYAYEASGFGAWCTIQCKPFFRKHHLKIENGKSTWERAYKYAAAHWNDDKQIYSAVVEKFWSDVPGVFVEIEEAEEHE